MGTGGENWTTIGPRRPASRGLRFRWGTTDLVLFSIPLEEHAPAPAGLDKVAANLSPAEGAVIELASRGYSNAEIAKRRATALSTTKKQLESAYRKLGVGSRAELVSLLARCQHRAR
jgi:DNA-binding CsgD family transcriptional regulator